MRRILILHALLGTGHLSAARALGDAFGRFPGVEVIVEDSLDFINPALSGLLKGVYKEIMEHAGDLYGRLYHSADTPDAHRAAVENLRGAEVGRIFFHRLTRYVAAIRPHAVIAVMAVPLALSSQLKVEGALECPLYGVITDFVAHSAWIYPGVARYFVPSAFTADMLIAHGLESALLQITGIPVSLDVAAPKDPAAVRARRGLPTGRPVITVFGGGVENRTIREIVAQILAAGQPLTLVVCAGRNASLLDALSDLEGSERVGLVKYGMVDFVDDLIVASDLVISKPGGLITSEVLARRTPMIGIAPLPGQEEPNADFLALTGAGVPLRVAELGAAAALHLLGEPELLARMRANGAHVGRPRAALTIAEQVLADLDGR